MSAGADASTSYEMLAGDYDVILADLDGTLLLAGNPIAHAVQTTALLRAAGIRLMVVTNNASRTPADVASRLAGRDMRLDGADIVTSSQAAAALLAERHPGGAPVLIVGAGALATAVADAGLMPVRSASAHPVAVVQGYSPDLGWRDLAEGCVAINAGAQWVATNTDATLPSDRGMLPGNGAMVAALAVATGQQPTVAGKPQRSLIDAARARADAAAPLMVGDRLETDIAAASAAQCDSLLVLTGASTVDDLLATDPALRPTYLAADLRGLIDRRRCVRLGDYDDDQALHAACRAHGLGVDERPDSDTVNP